MGTERDGFSLPLRKCYGRPQAVLHLEDTAENQGGSKLLPGFHRLLAYQPSLRTRILDNPELSQRLGRNLLGFAQICSTRMCWRFRRLDLDIKVILTPPYIVH